MSVLIKGGTVVTADQTLRADVLCVDGKIRRIADTIDKCGECEEIDAGGQYIMPAATPIVLRTRLSTIRFKSGPGPRRPGR